MKLKSIIKMKYKSIRSCAENCGIPYTTLYELCSGKRSLYHCEAQTLFKLSKSLNMTMEEMLEGETFQIFRDNLHNQKKQLGDKRFLLKHLERNTINVLWDEEKQEKSLYLLAMVDLLCKRNNYPIIKEYEDKRKYKLKKPLFVGDSKLDKEKAKQQALPEFSVYNIYEGTIDDAI